MITFKEGDIKVSTKRLYKKSSLLFYGKRISTMYRIEFRGS